MPKMIKSDLLKALREVELDVRLMERKAPSDFPIPKRPAVRKAEAARLLSVSLETVERLIDVGKLAPVPAGVGNERRHVRVTTASIRELVK